MNNTEIYVAVRNKDALEYCKKQSMLEQAVGNEKWKHYHYAISALEKQIPKKPVVDESWFPDALNCPSCGTFVGFQYDHNDKFCHNCGQALDWSEIDDEL